MADTALVPFQEQLTDRKLSRQFSSHKADTDLVWAAEKQYALEVLRKNKYLLDCDPESFRMAMLDVAYTGLSLNPRLGHAYLIPYDGQIQFTPSYKGLEHLVYRAGTVGTIQSVLVRMGDSFQVQTLNNRRQIHHIEHAAPGAGVIAAYAILHYTGSDVPYVEVMSAPELAAVEAQAKSRRGGGAVWNGPWKGEMQRKAVLRRALKHAPQDNGGRMAKALEVSDKFDHSIIEEPLPEPQTQELLVSEEQVTQLHALLTEGGLQPDAADRWLKKMAEALGSAQIADLPASRFEEVKARLTTRLKAWKEKAA